MSHVVDDWCSLCVCVGFVDVVEINAVVPAVFAGTTALFFAMVFSTKCRKKQHEVDIEQARRVFVQDGSLSKPSVIRSVDQEAILRGWLSAKQVAWIMFLDVFASNALISLAFSWGHDHLVFTRADKVRIFAIVASSKTSGNCLAILTCSINV